MQVTFLGTGTSVGIPMIGCSCRVCRSDDPKNKRNRPSILITLGDKNILVDTSPEFRIQALTCGIDRIDAVLFTHSHADHLHGLDDLRVFSRTQTDPIPCFGNDFTLDRIRRAFDYIFNPKYYQGLLPNIKLESINGPFPLLGQTVVPVKVWHGKTEVLGFRLGRFAYVTDCGLIPDESMELLAGVEVLVLDALRWEPPHPAHLTIPQAVRISQQLGARQTYFTHMMHRVEHQETNARLPDGIQLAYDGLVIQID